MLRETIKTAADILCKAGSCVIVCGLAKDPIERIQNRALMICGKTAAVFLALRFGCIAAKEAETRVDQVMDILENAADGIRKAGENDGPELPREQQV